MRSYTVNRPYAIRKTPGEYPYYSPSLVFVSFFKNGNSSLENQYFSTFFKYRLKILIFASNFSNENENEAWALIGVFPK